jgi:large subunit ribosomal protein L25
MEKLELTAVTRSDRGKKNQSLRADGKTPAVVYGHGLETKSVSLDSKILEQVYTQAGSGKIITLKIDKEKATNVLIYDVQVDPRRGQLTHADLYVVRMDEKLTTDIPLHFVGDAPAVFRDGGVLLKALETVEVEALPADLPDSIEVDLSMLEDFESAIHISDLKVSSKVEILDEADTVVAKVDAPRTEEEMAELDAEVVEDVNAVQSDVESGAEVTIGSED